MIKTRKPTGAVPWPFILLAGRPKSGKSYAAAAFSASQLIDRTFMIEIGEGDADMYAALPGARYEIVEHDGSFQQILQAVQAIAAEPAPTGKPHCLVIDSLSNVWEMLVNEQEAVMMRRGKTSMTVDQWNTVKRQWRKLINAIQSHHGPVLATVRMTEVTVMDKGKPTTEKQWKIQGEKNLSFEATGVVEMFAPGIAYVTGLRSIRRGLANGERAQIPDFTVERLFAGLGITGESRHYTQPLERPEQFTDPTQSQEQQ